MAASKRGNTRGELGSHSEFKHLVDSEDDEEEVILEKDLDTSEPTCSLPTYTTMAQICGGIVLLGLLAAGLAFLSGECNCVPADVLMPCGKVRGHHCENIYMFKGIPYASPPTGPLRWRPPKEPTCWNDTLDAAEFKSMCAQVRPLTATGTVMGSEDCLYLNVWTPSVDPNANLNVMVWIHGGYLLIGSGSEPGYSPNEELAKSSNMVHVSFNYRLGAFGFLALDVLREGSPTNTSGNYGLMDQIEALKWVQKNIKYFGGDPNKVTIYGQSSGGTSVWALMTSLQAKGLFHRAIDMSGSPVFTDTMADAEKDNLVLLNRTGCTDAQCLRQLSDAIIIQSSPWEEYPNWSAESLCDLPQKGQFIGPLPVVDGYVVPVPPVDVWKKKMKGYNDVPLVIGTTLQESEFGPIFDNISRWTEEDYKWVVRSRLGTFGGSLAEDALALYPISEFCSTPERCVEKTYMTMVSDIRMSCPNNELAKLAAAALSSPVYRYQVIYTPSKPVRVNNLFSFESRFSFHMLDSLAFFNTMPYSMGEVSNDDHRFQRLIRKYLVYFAKEGHMPPEWPQYPNETALLSTSLTTEKDYRSVQCSLWEKNNMFPYAWKN